MLLILFFHRTYKTVTFISSVSSSYLHPPQQQLTCRISFNRNKNVYGLGRFLSQFLCLFIYDQIGYLIKYQLITQTLVRSTINLIISSLTYILKINVFVVSGLHTFNIDISDLHCIPLCVQCRSRWTRNNIHRIGTKRFRYNRPMGWSFENHKKRHLGYQSGVWRKGQQNIIPSYLHAQVLTLNSTKQATPLVVWLNTKPRPEFTTSSHTYCN